MTSSSSVGWNLKPGARAVGVEDFVGVSGTSTASRPMIEESTKMGFE